MRNPTLLAALAALALTAGSANASLTMVMSQQNTSLTSPDRTLDFTDGAMNQNGLRAEGLLGPSGYTFDINEPFYDHYKTSNPQFSGRVSYWAWNYFNPTHITTIDGADLDIMHFDVDSGYGGTRLMYIHWEAFLDGGLVGSGEVNDAPAANVHLALSGGLFDELRIAAYWRPFSSFDFAVDPGGANGIMLDNIQANLGAAAAVPEPTSMGLFALGCGALLWSRRRRIA